MELMGHLVFPINALPSVQMVEAGIDEILWDADLKFEALLRYYEKVDADVLFYFSDVVIQAESMGANVRYSKREMPTVKSPASHFSVPEPHMVSRMRINAEVLRRMERQFPDKFRAALVYGPFTVAGQIMGEEKLLKGILKDPKGVINIIKNAFECAMLYALYLMDAGANLLWISDPLSSLISPAQFQIFAGDFLKRLFHLFPLVPKILHICGYTNHIIPEMVETGTNGISFDNCMDLSNLDDQIPDDIYIIGNVDPVDVITFGTPERVVSCTMDIISRMGIKNNFILSTGCAVPPSAPLKNIRLFVETGKRAFHELRRNYPPLFPEIGKFVYENTLKSVKKCIE